MIARTIGIATMIAKTTGISATIVITIPIAMGEARLLP
jgi:hypothetical protein